MTRLPSRPSRMARRTSSGRGRSGPAPGVLGGGQQGGEQVQAVRAGARVAAVGGGHHAAGGVAGPRPSAGRAFADARHRQRAGAKGLRRRRAGLRGRRRSSTANSVVAVRVPLRRTGRRRAVGIGIGLPDPRAGLRQRRVQLVAVDARDRRTGRGGAGAAAPIRPPPGCPAPRRCSAPRHAACATAVRATTRSARMPSTSKAAHSAAMRRNSLSGNTTSSTSARAAAIRRASSASAVGIALRRTRPGRPRRPSAAG